MTPQEVIQMIKEHVNIDIVMCDCFTGIYLMGGKRYFNALLHESISESKDYDLLKNWADKYSLIRVKPNGLRRVAIFF